jgi:hypothetical protein
MHYDKGFDATSIIGEHDRLIKEMIKARCGPNTSFINTTWIEKDNDLKALLSSNPDKIVCYSGPDWENRLCRAKANEAISRHPNVTRFGNYNGDHYFSFWLDFVYEHWDKYNNPDVIDMKNNDIKKLYMCLNRKPHEHRILLVKNLIERGLEDYGYLSLGKFDNPWDYKGLSVPITLDKDVTNEEGDHAVAGDAGGITNDITSLGLRSNWNSHFLNIVSETTIHTDVFLSEKIFKPIIGMRPFIVLGDNNVYNILHSWGIDTFDDLFGEGYKHQYHTERIKWICNVIQNYKKRKDLKELLIELTPRLEHNKKMLLRAAKKNRKFLEEVKF